MKILLALTEEMVARPLAATLEFEGQVVESDPSGGDVLHLLQTGHFDALVVDPNLPHNGGIELIKAVRRAGHTLPLVVLSRFNDTRHKCLCFNAGADDHMMVPFDAKELFARIKAIARRSSGYLGDLLRVGDIVIDQQARNVRVDGAPVHCTRTEFLLLEALSLRPGRPVSQEVLYGLTHGSLAEGSSRVIDVFLHRLRKKLAAAGACTTIETVRLAGVRLKAGAAPAALVAEVA